MISVSPVCSDTDESACAYSSSIRGWLGLRGSRVSCSRAGLPAVEIASLQQPCGWIPGQCRAIDTSLDLGVSCTCIPVIVVMADTQWRFIQIFQLLRWIRRCWRLLLSTRLKSFWVIPLKHWLSLCSAHLHWCKLQMRLGCLQGYGPEMIEIWWPTLWKAQMRTWLREFWRPSRSSRCDIYDYIQAIIA